MPTRTLFAGGVGFSPGSVRYMPTLGLTPAGSATELTITCHGLPNSIHVQVEFEDEGWTDTAVSGFVEVYINGAWHDGTALFESFGESFSELHACIFGLEPNTTYPIRVTFRRYDVSEETNWHVGPNGLEDSGFDVVEEQIHEVEGTTAVDQPTLAQPRTKIYVDSENGSEDELTTGIAYDDAFKTLARVSAEVNNQPGYDIVYVGKCCFEGEILRDIDGAANRPAPGRSLCFVCLAFRPLRLQPPYCPADRFVTRPFSSRGFPRPPASGFTPSSGLGFAVP